MEREKGNEVALLMSGSKAVRNKQEFVKTFFVLAAWYWYNRATKLKDSLLSKDWWWGCYGLLSDM